ncbi:related to alanine racemase [Phialocephala subalpina]|uniref:D-serine dehydratase n=1 Tax=Phialocephala subalpina TaxID=576137 RepID=A0A1L7WS68_9HELO|nr:related to alanine racemase [Phialocephala subalpina]
MATTSLYPLSLKEELRKQFVGKSIKDVAGPAAVLDLSKLQNNCNRMLEACESLKFGWRAHIKTHKTTELTRLQVGSGTGPVNIIVSTLIEAEYVLPLILEYKAAGRAVNLLYSFPVTPSTVDRLSLISFALGPNGLSLTIDHPDQLHSVAAIHKNTSLAPQIFLKIDMGGRRAGVAPQTTACSTLISNILSLEASGSAQLLGLYSHAGQSYFGSNRADALDFLRQEFEALLVTASAVQSLSSPLPTKTLVLSVGATPTTTSVRNLLIDNEDTPEAEGKAIASLRATIEAIRSIGCGIEIHAGVYPTLDVQQLATHCLPTTGPHAMLTWGDLAFTVVAEVASLYPGRGKDGAPEALVGSGSLALGREPCKAYSGWGIVSPWNREGVRMPAEGPEKHVGWHVGRISQEHGILVWSGEGIEPELLEVGQKVRIWPNHACVAGAGFGWYLVVDETRKGKEDEIIDVWPRWRGW